ncbi:MAG: FHA domain-containing protein [Cellvibrionaceae bacterium]|nr:FHA domain-containing protein [Cellvibrionaceae bacterium]
MQTKFRLKSLRSDQTHILDKASTLIGRSSQCDIQVDSGLLSRHHASVLVVDAETVILKDLESTNGTFVNTMRIARPTRLKHGDVITIGDEKFVFIDLEVGEEQAAYDVFESGQFSGLAAEGNNNRTMIESSFFRVVSMPGIEVQKEPADENNSQFMARALGKKPLDAHLTPAVLLVKSGIKKGSLIELKLPVGVDREWSLGRSQLCDVVLEDPTVSNQHAVIRWENGYWEIQDNRSTNGVSLNGKKVTRSVFENGDVIAIGNIKMVFRVI